MLSAANAWLHSQSRQRHGQDQDSGYVCTLTVMVLKGATAPILHIGDARIHRLRDGAVEQLTEDHRVWVAHDKLSTGRALGLAPTWIDYHPRPWSRAACSCWRPMASTSMSRDDDLREAVAAHAGDLDAAARALVALALARGSGDNLTVQIVRVDALPARQAAR